jgi:pimeloyl-ACP methyl ester carboxylesterase
VVAGHSLGGDVAVLLGARRPDLVRALVVIAAGSLTASTPVAAAWLRGWSALRVSKLGGVLRRPLARRARLRRLAFAGWGAERPAALPSLVAYGYLESLLYARDTATAREALLADDALAVLPPPSCPALVVWGARDRTTPLEHGFVYARRLGAALRTIAGAGHLVPGERPGEVCAAIEQFLDGIRDVDELPVDAESLGDPPGQRLDA